MNSNNMFVGKYLESCHLEYQDKDGKIILKLVLKRKVTIMLTVVKWLRTEKNW
jgi:hypothetical protein